MITTTMVGSSAAIGSEYRRGSQTRGGASARSTVLYLPTRRRGMENGNRSSGSINLLEPSSNGFSPTDPRSFGESRKSINRVLVLCGLLLTDTFDLDQRGPNKRERVQKETRADAVSNSRALLTRPESAFKSIYSLAMATLVTRSRVGKSQEPGAHSRSNRSRPTDRLCARALQL